MPFSKYGGTIFLRLQDHPPAGATGMSMWGADDDADDDDEELVRVMTIPSSSAAAAMMEAAGEVNYYKG